MLDRTDITMYSDDKLSLVVDNEEYLYFLKEQDFPELLDILKDEYIYTVRQLEVLKEDYEAEKEENDVRY